jgi:hypothetical protein
MWRLFIMNIRLRWREWRSRPTYEYVDQFITRIEVMCDFNRDS